MSNSIYNILNRFNKLAQEVSTPAATKPQSKTPLQESMEQVVSEKYMGFKKTVAAVKKGGSAENPEAVAASIGRKKYGKEKFQQAAAKGKKLGEQLTPGYPTPAVDKYFQTRDRLKQLGHEESPNSGAYVGAYSRDEQGQKKYIDRTTPGVVNTIKDKLGFDKPDPAYAPKAAAGNVKEVAPPGAKAERMVKHVKKGYAKDGKLTPKEKSIAYATAWKAHKAGKVEEAVNALRVLTDAGMTKEQIAEGWEDMMKAADKRAKEKGTGKFDKKNISTGTVYTRKYDPKTGETDDSENVTAVKKGRGRPKKSAFESFVNDYAKTLNEGTVYTAKMGQPPQDIDGRSATPTPKTTAPKGAPTDVKNMGTAAKAMMAPNYVNPKAKVLPSDPEGVKEQSGPAHSGLKDPSAAAKYDSFMQQRKNDSAAMVAKIKPPMAKEDNATTNVSPMPVAKNTSTHGMRDEWIAKYGKTHNTMGTPKAPGMMPNDDQSSAEIGRLSNVAGMNAANKRVSPIPVTKNTSTASMRDDWMSKYGQSHNADGTPKSKATNEDDMEEGNAFSGAVAKAKADGIQPGEKITVGGKEYDLKEDDVALNQMRKIAGLQECGMMSGDAMGRSEGTMSINTSMSTDGAKNVTVTANGDAADDLMQMLKLAGMNHSQPEAEVEADEPMEEEKDPRYEASTTPDEDVKPVQVLTKGGNGDVAGQEKEMKPEGYKFSDNPLAMKESIDDLSNMGLELMKAYESIKLQK